MVSIEHNTDDESRKSKTLENNHFNKAEKLRTKKIQHSHRRNPERFIPSRGGAARACSLRARESISYQPIFRFSRYREPARAGRAPFSRPLPAPSRYRGGPEPKRLSGSRSAIPCGDLDNGLPARQLGIGNQFHLAPELHHSGFVHPLPVV